MAQKNIVTGQRVLPAKAALAKKFRREMTPAEAHLWRALRAGRLEGFHFRRQQVIEPFIVDFYCHKTDLVIEVDGGVHQMMVDADRQRQEFLEVRGLRVLRFSNREVLDNLEAVLGMILEACQASTGGEWCRGNPPRPSLKGG